MPREDSVKYKGISFEVKKRKVRGKDVFRFVGSSEEMDRGGDIIETSGWDLSQFEKNPVILWNHNKSIPPIGRAVRSLRKTKDKQLVFDIEFVPKGVHPLADTIRGLVERGFQRAVSVGFIPKDMEPIDEKDLPDHLKDSFGVPNRIKNAELVELSLTPIGQHQDALGSEDNISKSAVDDYIDELQVVTKSLKKWKHLHTDEKEESEVDTDEKKKPKLGEDGELDLKEEDEDREEDEEEEEGGKKPKKKVDSKEEDEEEEDEEDEESKSEKASDEENEEEEDEDDEEEESSNSKSIRYLEFDKDVFKSLEDVEKWVKSNRYSLTKVKEGEFFFRVTQRHSDEFCPSSKFVSEEIAEGVHSSVGKLKEPAELAAIVFDRSTKRLAEEVTKSINLLRKEVGIMRKCFLEKMTEMADASYVSDLQSFERSEKSDKKTSNKSTAQEQMLTDAVSKLMNTVTLGDNSK